VKFYNFITFAFDEEKDIDRFLFKANSQGERKKIKP